MAFDTSLRCQRFDSGDADLRGRLDIKFDAGLLYVKSNFGSTNR